MRHTILFIAIILTQILHADEETYWETKYPEVIYGLDMLLLVEYWKDDPYFRENAEQALGKDFVRNWYNQDFQEQKDALASSKFCDMVFFGSEKICKERLGIKEDRYNYWNGDKKNEIWEEYKKVRFKKAIENNIERIDNINEFRKAKQDAEIKRNAIERRKRMIREVYIFILELIPVFILISFGAIWVNRHREKAHTCLILPFLPRNLAATITCLMLLLALADMPYWYYTLLRVAICAYSISGILMSKPPVHRMLYIGIALLYNPVSPVHLDRDIWAPINLATAALITTLHLLRPRLSEKQ